MKKKYIVLAVLFVAVAVSFYAFAAKPKIAQDLGQKVMEAVAPTAYEPMFAPTAAEAAGATSIYAKIGDITGEVSEKDHKGYVAIDSWTWGTSRTGDTAGGASGRTKAKELILKVKTDKSSPKLLEAAIKGTTLSRLEVALRQSGKSYDFMKWTITEAAITSFVTSASGTEASIDELTISITGSVKAEYRESNGATITSGWNFKDNKSM